MKPNIDHAIEVFSSISDQLGPQYLAYVVLPNTVLTLCGARAYCDGVFWDSDKKGLLEKWHEELFTVMEVVKKQGKVLWSDTAIEQTISGEKYASFELTVKDGLQYALTHTNLLDSIRPEDALAKASRAEIIDMFVTHLKSRSAYKEYSKENLQHIAFGILLSYPDKAISESVLYWGNDDDPFAEPLIDADIRGASYYTCPQPVYSYPRHLITDPTINTHEKLWSSLLRDYYQSDFHTSLEKNSAFQDKLRELGSLR